MGSGGNVGVLESFVIYSTSDQRRALYDGRRAHTLTVTQHESLRVGKTDDRRTYVVRPQLSPSASPSCANGGGPPPPLSAAKMVRRSGPPLVVDSAYLTSDGSLATSGTVVVAPAATVIADVCQVTRSTVGS